VRYALILLLAAAALAGEKELLERFRESVADGLGAGNLTNAQQAIEALGAEGGPKSVEALAKYVRETFEETRKQFELIAGYKLHGAEAFRTVERLGREIEHLEKRQQAGATGLDPQIEARKAEVAKSQRVLEGAKRDTTTSGRIIEQIGDLRQAAADTCSAMLARLEGEQFAAALAAVQAPADLGDETESLLLIRTLRHAKRAETAPVLLAIYTDPKTHGAARVEAACAVAFLGERDTIKKLLDGFDAADEAATNRLLHALSRHARRKLESLDDAKRWIAEPAG